MRTELVYTPEMATYRLSQAHPLRPERFTLAVELMRAWGLICDDTPAPAEQPVGDRSCAVMVAPEPASEPDLLRVHTPDYLWAVKRAGEDPDDWREGFGIGPGDTPAFPRMHEASALIAGGTVRALGDVVSGACERSFAPAGGLHHAHRDYASGFCVYNDPAVAIANVTAHHPGLRVAYVDVDAHHGDGVQAAFYERADVLTVSVHESGRYLFPGSGREVETGQDAGCGCALNIPLPPAAGDESFRIAFERAIAPAVRAYAPDVIVAQLGADSHIDDPLTHLATTVRGQCATTRRIVELAEEICGGKLCAMGGGGYDSFSAVPRAWACALAVILGREVPDELPLAWREHAEQLARAAGLQIEVPLGTFGEPREAAAREAEDTVRETARVIERLEAQHPLLRKAAGVASEGAC